MIADWKAPAHPSLEGTDVMLRPSPRIPTIIALVALAGTSSAQVKESNVRPHTPRKHPPPHAR